MHPKRRRILFFTPYATRTGSEMLIYYILKHFDRDKFEVGLVCFSPGELLKDLPPDIPVYVVSTNFSFSQKIAYHLGLHPIRRAIKRISKEFKSDIWYINTIMLANIIDIAKEIKMPIITHVQELSAMYSQISSNDFKSIVTDSNLLIGCSDIVCKCLAESGGKRIERLYNFVDLNEINPDEEKVKLIRKEWGVNPGDFVWIMSGTSSERKGFDMLPEIAARIPENAQMHLVWVGKRSNDGLVYWTEQRCKNIKNVKIHLIGAKKEDYYSYMDAADGFMLTSRQEPFGMVLVEATWLGKPIVCFDDSGPAEFITPDTGTVVPSLNIDLFVEGMLKWNNKMATLDKAILRKKAIEFSTEKGVQEWQRIMEDF